MLFSPPSPIGDIINIGRSLNAQFTVRDDHKILETFAIRKYLEFYEHTCFKPVRWKACRPHL